MARRRRTLLAAACVAAVAAVTLAPTQALAARSLRQVPSANANGSGATTTYASSSPALLTAAKEAAAPVVISAPKDAPANAVVSLPSPEEIAAAVQGAKAQEKEQEAPLKAEEKKEKAEEPVVAAEPVAAPAPNSKRQPNPITGRSSSRSNGNKNANSYYPTMAKSNARNVPLTPNEQRRSQAFNANAEVAAVSLEEARHRMADALEALQGAIFERAQEGAEAIFGPEGPFSGPFWRDAERDMVDEVEAELEEQEEDDDDAAPPSREQQQQEEDDDLLRSALYGRNNNNNNNNNNNRGNNADDDDLSFNSPIQRSVVRVQLGPYQTASPFASSSAAGAFPRGFGGGGLFGPFGPGPVMYPPQQQHMMQQMQQQQYQAPPRAQSRPGVTRAQMAELDAGVKDAGKALDEAMRAFNEAMGKRVQAGLVTFFEGYAPEKAVDEGMKKEEMKKKEGVAVAAIPAEAVEEEKKVEVEAAAPVVAAAEEKKAEEAKKEEAPKEEKKIEEKKIEEESPAKAAPIEEEKKAEAEAVVAPVDAPVAPVATTAAAATAAEAPKEKEAEVKA